MGYRDTEKESKIETLMSTEVKSMVAKLLSKENITIQRGKFETASFDIKNRVLRLPLWDNMSNDELDLFIGHEVSHALNTPHDCMERFKKKCKGVPFSVCNVVEDIRIEKMIQKEYPGLIRSFVGGYTALYNKDFFKLGEIPMEDRGLIDRINIKAKLRKLVDVPFSEEELPLVKKAFNCKSFNDVLTVSKELKDWVDENEPEEDNEDNTESFSNDSSDNNDSIDEGSESNSDWAPSDDGITDESFNEALEELENEYTKNDLSGYDDGFQDDGTEAESVESEEGGAGREGGIDGRYSPASQKAFEDSLDDERLDKDMDSYYSDRIFQMVDYNLKDIKKTIIPYSEVLKSRMENSNFIDYLNDTYNDYSEEYKKFNATSKKFINNLKSEFEMKKSAYQYSRATVAKSGVLDVNKLHAYKYSEDIFSSITTLADAKSHGMFFIVDMSASMSNEIGTVYKQAINLSMFCKAVGIPFKVYGFTNIRNYYGRNGETEEVVLPQVSGSADLDDLKIVELLSSDMKKNDWKQALRHTFLASECFDSYYGNEPSAVEKMSGTPLSETAIVMTHLIKEFKEKHKIQKMSTMFLTDGAGQSLRFHNENTWNAKAIGKIAGKMCTIDFEGRDSGFNSIINHLRDVTGSTVSHFFLTGSKNEISYASYYYLTKDETKQWRNDKIVVREKGQGFPHKEHLYIGAMDKVFILNSNRKTDLTDANNFSDVDTDNMTDAQLSRAFINNQTSRKKDRVFVNKFMEMVA